MVPQPDSIFVFDHPITKSEAFVIGSSDTELSEQLLGLIILLIPLQNDLQPPRSAGSDGSQGDRLSLSGKSICSFVVQTLLIKDFVLQAQQFDEGFLLHTFM